jgi:putative ABC transport system ATP-binding protein
MMALLKLENLTFAYDTKNVLKNVNFEFEPGKIYAVVGRSGAGKTTLLSLLSGLATPNQGDILYKGKSIKELNKYDFRRKCVGVVFQSFNLLTNLTAAENVILSMDISGVKKTDKDKFSSELLKKVGLNEDETRRRILKLSGGQQQRVAIARALSFNPDIILADEPTGNLDIETQEEILQILRKLADEGKCIILVTHSPTVAEKADVMYKLKRAI